MGGALKSFAPPHVGKFEGPHTGCHQHSQSETISCQVESAHVQKARGSPIRCGLWRGTQCRKTCSIKMSPLNSYQIALRSNQSPNHFTTLLLPRPHIAAAYRPCGACCHSHHSIMPGSDCRSHNLISVCAPSSAHAHRRPLVAAEAHRRPGAALLDDALHIQEVRPQLHTADMAACARGLTGRQVWPRLSTQS